MQCLTEAHLPEVVPKYGYAHPKEKQSRKQNYPSAQGPVGIETARRYKVNEVKSEDHIYQLRDARQNEEQCDSQHFVSLQELPMIHHSYYLQQFVLF